MNRRTVVKQLFIIAGGIALLPSCLREQGGASIVLKNIKLSATDEDFLGKLVEILIPKTDSPGGLELNLHLFVMKMVDDCESPENQDLFLKGMHLLKDQYRSGTPDYILRSLTTLESQKEGDEVAFFNIFKKRAIQGYLNSEYVMKNKLIYKLIPGKYEAAVKLKA
ncbi:gluconate 2-dehydrogenase subunit 3 family protein [Sphingobacterium sp. SRCM116780]|uniref:gluconate 2-dehydrogenase subunit 3 family protein n=1 Tax=Sphingobacterium sp. SRCM116780 TaxID=2907623 RepID=UPI001F37BDD1|nr:gluconate 2-dehydrogenase subunit 3 family protein [Sphingobacterium sp. SRCM116780]UIR56200.1 gluconate 2-dehydrogenase subunit 3 family protein [Sphingobacterium sp. SRCM116780]